MLMGCAGRCLFLAGRARLGEVDRAFVAVFAQDVGHARCLDLLMVVTDGHARRTSRTAGRDTGPADECYHLACYTVVARCAGSRNWRSSAPRRGCPDRRGTS